MRLQQLLSLSLLSATAEAASRSLRHVGRADVVPEGLRQAMEGRSFYYEHDDGLSKRAGPQFLTNKTMSFAVNGTGIPDVDFDVGESYSGYLPISSNASDTSKLFWWFFPSTNPDASKEILIWLNGGPGCSSFEGLLQENGPFLWQYGTFAPVPNPWAWNRLTNVVWVEQPVGTGFSTGTVTATSEEDVAAQFLGFWKNFVDLFAMQGYKVYIAGESYAGMYCPYIASAMLDQNDTTTYNLSGMIIYDPVITYSDIQNPVTTMGFVDYWTGLFPFNDSFVADLHARDASCGYRDYVDKYLVFPPAGEQPTILPGQNSSGVTAPECENIYNDVFTAASIVNPCFDIYQVATTCPLLWDVLGFPGSFNYLPAGASVYFNRTDVKQAIHAPLDIDWEECSEINVFVDGVDNSLPSALTVLPGVIERTQNVIVGHGALDMILIANGTLLAIQNMTWGGAMGFQTAPTEPFFVPYHDDPVLGAVAGSGVFGTAHTERGLTFVQVDLSGHMIPQYAPSAAYRHLEFLLGRVPAVGGAAGLSSTAPFSTDANVTQPTAALGNGTAPQGFSTGNGTGSGSSSGSGGSGGPSTTTKSAAARSLVPGGSAALVLLSLGLALVAF